MATDEAEGGASALAARRRCEWCAYETEHRQNLYRHRLSCAHRPSTAHGDCRRCACGYATPDRGNWNRHQRTCAASSATDVHDQLVRLREALCEKDRQLAAHEQRLRDTSELIELKDRQIDELLSAAREERKRPRVITHSMKVVLVAPAYGAEPPPDVENVVKLLDDPSTSVREYVRLRHLAGKAQNVRLTNKRSKTIEVVRDVDGIKRWVHEDMKMLVEDMVDTSRTDLRGIAEELEPPHERWIRYDNLVSRTTDGRRRQRELVERVLMDRA